MGMCCLGEGRGGEREGKRRVQVCVCVRFRSVCVCVCFKGVWFGRGVLCGKGRGGGEKKKEGRKQMDLMGFGPKKKQTTQICGLHCACEASFTFGVMVTCKQGKCTGF